jgi:hypothetical protein
MDMVSALMLIALISAACQTLIMFGRLLIALAGIAQRQLT